MAKRNALNYREARIKLIRMDEKGLDVPIVCKVCENAPCIEVCPTHSLIRDPLSGSITVYEPYCIGCGLCAEMCPIGAISIHAENGVAAVCDLCMGSPLCVQYCPTQALTYEEPDLSAHKKAMEYAKTIVSCTKNG
jgi:Fe-S-cluster-containing hydrogenase component 2